jgi:hypothetical protein
VIEVSVSSFGSFFSFLGTFSSILFIWVHLHLFTCTASCSCCKSFQRLLWYTI